METKSNAKLKALFIIPSVVGVILFMIPVKNAAGEWTVVVKILADIISGVIGGFLPLLCVLILTVSAVMSLIALAKPKFIMNSDIMKECFACKPIWVVIRVLAVIFVWLTYLGVGEEDVGLVGMITGGGQGGFVLYDLLTTLVIIFVIAALLLPLLLDFGLLEFVGALLTKVMRPLFKVPGRAAVDCITSWIGDGTLGVMLTCNQYEGGYYSAKEASIIATLFSAVSITFTLVVLDTVGMLDKFGIYYLIVCFVGIVCAIVCPYLYPLRKKPNTYLVSGKAAPDTLPEGYKSNVQYGMDLAMKRVAEHKGVGEFFASGLKNACSMWFGVLPSVMAIGTIALILANFTPIFEWLGIPFRPLLQLLQVPEAEALWTGVMEVMNQCHLTDRLASLFRPLLKRLLPNASRDSETLAAISANLSADLLGLGNAATPLGIRAACRMSRGCKGIASDELCLLVVLNTASIQLLPTTLAGVRASLGTADPFDILPAVWLTSLLSVLAGLLAAKLFAHFWRN